MNRDVLKTTGAIILIVGIVATTFWYGNKQRNQQIKSDQTTAKTQVTGKGSTQATAPTPPPAGGPAPAPAAAAVAPPATAPTSIPETGSGFEFVLPVAAIVGVVVVKRNSDKALKQALLAS